MSKFVAEWLSTKALDLLYEMIQSSKESRINKWKLNRFLKKLRKDIEEFCRRNESKYLNSSAFDYYINNSKVLEKIINRATSTKVEKSQKEFLRNQVKEAREIAEAEGVPFSHNEERLIKDLFKTITEKVTMFYSKSLSPEQRVAVSRFLEGVEDIKDAVNEIKAGENNQYLQLKDHIDSLMKISDLSAEPIAKLVFNKAWNGNLDEIEKLMPLICGKSKDLEILCNSVLSLFSSCEKSYNLETLGDINNSEIRNIAVRLVLPILLFKENSMDKLKNVPTTPALEDIVNACIFQEKDKLFIQNIEIDNGTELHSFVLNKRLVCEEEWLIKQIFILYLYKSNIGNVSELMKQIKEGNETWLTVLLTVDKEIDVLIYTNHLGDNNTKIDILAKNFPLNENIVCKLCRKAKIMYYAIMVKSFLCMRKIEDAEKIMPKELESFKPLSNYKMQMKIEKSEISLEEIENYCRKNGELWLLNNYFITRMDEKKLINFCSSNDDLLKEDAILFFMFMGALRAQNRIPQIREYLLKYKDNFKNVYEYWNEFLRVDLSQETKEAFLKECQNGKMGFLLQSSEYLIIERLFQLQDYDLAQIYIHRLELKEGNSFEVKKYNAFIEQCRGNQVKAINLLQESFDENQDDVCVIDSLLTLSLMNNRTVEQKCIDAALKIGTSRMYLLVSAIRDNMGNISGARQTLIKSMLLSEDDSMQAFAQYISMETETKGHGGAKITVVEADTAIYAVSDINKEQCFCIYKEKVLPFSPFKWNDGIHIYIEDAAQLEILRKHIGNSFIYDDVHYTIKGIESLESYFFRTSMTKLHKVGAVQTLSLPAAEDNEGTELLKKWLIENTPDEKETINWLEQYNTFDDVPLSLFLYKGFSRASYSQFVDLLLEDKNIFVREAECHAYLNKNYVLSFAAIWILYKIGFPAEEIVKSNTYITVSEKVQIENDATSMIKEYDKDKVTSMGVFDGHIFVNETDEAVKGHWLKEAGTIKRYCDTLKTIDNTEELNGEFFKTINSKKFFGICDYDTIAIAQNKDDYSVVTVEAIITSLAFNDSTKIQCVTLVDWLISLNLGAIKLMDYIEKMMGIGCVGSLTSGVAIYISKQINQLENERENFYKKWDELLLNIDSLQGKVKDAAIQRLAEVFLSLNQDFQLVDNTLIKLLARDTLLLRRQKIQILVGEDGSMTSRILNLPEEEPVAKIKNIKK